MLRDSQAAGSEVVHSIEFALRSLEKSIERIIRVKGRKAMSASQKAKD